KSSTFATASWLARAISRAGASGCWTAASTVRLATFSAARGSAALVGSAISAKAVTEAAALPIRAVIPVSRIVVMQKLPRRWTKAESGARRSGVSFHIGVRLPRLYSLQDFSEAYISAKSPVGRNLRSERNSRGRDFQRV